MRRLHSAALAGALTAALAVGLATAGTTANAETATAGTAAQPAAASQSLGGAATVAANEREVRAFLRDVIDEHHGDHAARYLTPGMEWHGGKISAIWAGDDWTAILYYTGTYKAPWIP